MCTASYNICVHIYEISVTLINLLYAAFFPSQELFLIGALVLEPITVAGPADRNNLQHVLGLPQGLLISSCHGHTQNTSPGRHSRSILSKCPKPATCPQNIIFSFLMSFPKHYTISLTDGSLSDHYYVIFKMISEFIS